jgi:D-alanine-D-alanine ligase
VKRILKPWGKLLIDIADGGYLRDNFQRRSWEWINSRLFVCRERSLSYDSERLVSREVITHVEKGVIADQFYAERLYSQESIGKLLTDAGFAEVSFPTELTPDSKRAQDLGMMERRIIVTSLIKKSWSIVKQRPKKDERHVVVIMGDPDKPDPLKPLHIFDEDDFYTIDQLKAALREIKGYRFTYLNNHDTLIQDLQKLAGKFDLVLNLCDEGYLNDPRKELHIPSLIETMGFPYSGAGPQCIAFCYDKSLVRGVAKEMDIPVSEGIFIKPEDSTFKLSFDFPVLVKPNFGDSSFGITADSVANDEEELINAVMDIRQKFGYEKPILVEEFLTGKDLTLGIIGTPPGFYFTLPILEEDYSELPEDLPRICGYEAKWRPDSPYFKIKSIPAELPRDIEKQIYEWCVKLAERLECRDYTRFDWRLDSEGKPKLLEVNPNPGWCWDGHLAKMAAQANMSYSEMLRAILKAVEERLGLESVEEAQQNGKANGKVEEKHMMEVRPAFEEPRMQMPAMGS